ncbi:MAG: hypothetical protein WBE64_15000, partial [Xanthobacteraceae bacterium]
RCDTVARARVCAVTAAAADEPVATTGDDERSAPATMAVATGAGGLVAAAGAAGVAGAAFPPTPSVLSLL